MPLTTTNSTTTPAAVADAPSSPRPGIVPTDGELLTQFTCHDDSDALAQVVDRHAVMVWSVVTRVLRHAADAEDAYQATMLLLARKATGIRANDSAAGWLFRVAHHTALLAKRRRKSRRETPLDDSLPGGEPPAPEAAFPDFERQQTIATLIEELRGLPAKYQTPLVLRYLEGKSRRQIADATDATVATVAGQLVRGKRMLRLRLARRGVSLAVAMAAFAGTAEAAEGIRTPPPISSPPLFDPGLIAAGASAAVSTLVTQGARSMLFASLIKPAAVGLAGAAVALVLLAEAPTAANPGAASQKNGASGSPPGVVLDTTPDAEPPAGAPAIALAQNEDPPSRKRQRSDQPGETNTLIAPTITTKDGQPATIGVESEGQKTELTVTPTIQGDAVQIAAEVSMQELPDAEVTGRGVFVPGSIEGMELGDMGLGGKKLSDAEQSAFLKKRWAKRAAADPPPAAGRPGFKELHIQHTYWEMKYRASRRKGQLMLKEVGAQREALSSSAGPPNEQALRAIMQREVEIELFLADAWKARAEMLRVERELKQAALRETSAAEPVETLTPQGIPGSLRGYQRPNRLNTRYGSALPRQPGQPRQPGAFPLAPRNQQRFAEEVVITGPDEVMHAGKKMSVDEFLGYLQKNRNTPVLNMRQSAAMVGSAAYSDALKKLTAESRKLGIRAEELAGVVDSGSFALRPTQPAAYPTVQRNEPWRPQPTVATSSSRFPARAGRSVVLTRTRSVTYQAEGKAPRTIPVTEQPVIAIDGSGNAKLLGKTVQVDGKTNDQILEAFKRIDPSVMSARVLEPPAYSDRLDRPLVMASPAPKDQLAAALRRIEEQGRELERLRERIEPSPQPLPAVAAVVAKGVPDAEVSIERFTKNSTRRSRSGLQSNPMIQPGETLAIEVYDRLNDRSLSASSVRVDGSGEVALGARWGRVKVAGKTLAEAEQAIHKQMARETDQVQTLRVLAAEENGHKVKKERVDIAVQVTRVEPSAFPVPPLAQPPYPARP